MPNINSEPIDNAAIPAVLSLDRHSTYLAACHGDQARAVRLYGWNVAISAALWGGFNIMEVALRNAMHEQLTKLAGREDWWNGRLPLFPYEQSKVTDVVAAMMAEKGAALRPGHVVADLTLGFWVKLLANGYHQRLWVPALQFAFPNINRRRRDLHRDLERLRKLRNRAAHHEPVFARNLADDHARVLSVLDTISPAAKDWVDHDSRVPQVLATRQAMVDGQVPTSF